MGKVVFLSITCLGSIFGTDLCEETRRGKTHVEISTIVLRICNKDLNLIKSIKKISYLEYLGEPKQLNLARKADVELLQSLLFDSKNFKRLMPPEITEAHSFSDALKNSISAKIDYGLLTEGFPEKNLSFETPEFAYEITLEVKNGQLTLIGFRIFPKSKI